MMKKIATVVVTYNRSKELIRCLDAITKQSYKPEVVYIIDNASTDDTYQKLDENKFLDNNVKDIVFKYIKMKNDRFMRPSFGEKYIY